MSWPRANSSQAKQDRGKHHGDRLTRRQNLSHCPEVRPPSGSARATFRTMDWDRLIAAATAARAHAYAPYSRYDVGAALLMEDGSVFAAANVENCLPALGTCAERNAMCAALSAGKRRPVAVAVVTASSP